MKAKKKKRAPSLPRLKAKLDTLFSLYIRRRDADHNGMVTCIACGKRFHWQEVDCGHFVPRQHLAVRWDERNAHPECRYCNRFRVDHYIDYTDAMRAKYGDEVIDSLKAARYQSVKLTRADYEAMIDYMSGRLAAIQAGGAVGRGWWEDHAS